MTNSVMSLIMDSMTPKKDQMTTAHQLSQYSIVYTAIRFIGGLGVIHQVQKTLSKASPKCWVH